MPDLIVPIILVVGIMAVLASFAYTVSRSIVKVPPNLAAVRTGVGGRKTAVGGWMFVLPMVHEVKYMKLNNMNTELSVQKVPDKNGVMLNVAGIANVKVSSSENLLPVALENFLGQEEGEIKETAKSTLETILRSIIGSMDVEELLRDREKLQEAVVNQGATDLARLGIDIRQFNFERIWDDNGYIESLGKQKTAEIVRNAKVGEADALRDTDLKTSDARRQGEVAKAKADQEVSDAHRQRDMRIAENAAQVKAQEARVAPVAERAAVEENKLVSVAKIDAEQAVTDRQIALQDVIRRRTEAELEATVVTEAKKRGEAAVIQAEKDKEARVIRADAEQQAALREGEAERVRAEKTAQGELAKAEAAATGRKATAFADQAELVAKAEGHKAQGLAEAEVRRANLMSEADGIRAKLYAEAEGLEKKAEALAKLDETGRMLMVLEALPPIIDRVGHVVEKIVVPAAEAIGTGIGNVDEIRLIDLGGSGGSQFGGDSVLRQFTTLPVETLVRLAEKAKSTGIDKAITAALSGLGINFGTIEKALGEPSTSTVGALKDAVAEKISTDIGGAETTAPLKAKRSAA